jgi:hypothetical protein
MIEHLPSKHKALSSNPTTITKEKMKENRSSFLICRENPGMDSSGLF